MKPGDRVKWGSLEGEVKKAWPTHAKVLLDGAPEELAFSFHELKVLKTFKAGDKVKAPNGYIAFVLHPGEALTVPVAWFTTEHGINGQYFTKEELELLP